MKKGLFRISIKEYLVFFILCFILGALPPMFYGANILNYFVPYGLWYLLYCGVIALILVYITSYTRRKHLVEPMLMMGDATEKVAHGDFSVYLAPLSSLETSSYINEMFHDFNIMVRELGSLETLKTDFITTISHEIKTPLATIQGYVQLLQNGNIDPSDYEATIESLTVATKNLSALTTNILNLSKLENQGIIANQSSFNVCRQLADCAVLFVDEWERKDINFLIDTEDRATLFADPHTTELIWRNLLSNATKFTHQGGCIQLTQTSTENHIIVSIRDDGIGMNQDTMNHVFDKFYQGDTSRSQTGNGLGLALVYRAVELLDGSISVESEEGKGTCFTVRLKTQK